MGRKSQFRVLFVCMGNICRSPAAEGVFREYVKQSGNDTYIGIDSAGTIGYHSGELPDSRMREAARRRGYALDSRARQVSRNDIVDYDLIVAMDHDNYHYLTALADDMVNHIRLLGHFLEPHKHLNQVKPVPDPYYGGDPGFEMVLDMIESACEPMLKHCLDTRENPSR